MSWRKESHRTTAADRDSDAAGDSDAGSSCTGVILAGGKASRYSGLPKGLERVGGERIIDRVATALRGACDDLLLVANDPAAAGWLPGVRTVADVITDAGGLGGIHAALLHSGTDVLVVAWDMPFVPASLLRALLAHRSHADAVVPSSGSWRGLEPLCAFYSLACVAPIERALEAGDRRVIAFHSEVTLHVLQADEVSRYGDPGTMFMNINTPDERQVAERRASGKE